jgi:hypothetical protein
MATPRLNRTPAIGEGRARCESCNYDLRGIAVGGRCPECGAVVPAPPATAAIDQGRPDHRDSGLHVIAVSQYFAFVPMSGLLLAGCAGAALGVVSVFGPITRLVALRSRWRMSPLRAIQPTSFGERLHHLALIDVVVALAYLASIFLPLPPEAHLPLSAAYALMATLSVVITNLMLSRIFTEWDFSLPILLAKLGLVAGCLAGLATTVVIVVRVARPGPDLVAIITVLGLVIGIITALLAVFAARDGIGRVEEVLITDLIEAHAERVGREPTPLADRFRRDHDSDPLPLETERPPIREDLEQP